MKIAIVNLILTSFRDTNKYYDIQVFNLGKALAKIGHDVTIFASSSYNNDATEEVNIDGIKVKYISDKYKYIFPPIYIPYTPDLKKELIEGSFDVIHTADFLQFGTIFSILSKKNNGMRVIVWQELDKFPRFPGGIIQKIYAKTLGIYVKNKVDAFIAKTSQGEKFLLRLGIPDEKISIVSPGVDLKKYYPFHDVSFKQNLHINDDLNLIISIARLETYKGLNYLIKAMAKVIENYPAVRLVIVGEGSQKNNLNNLIRELKLEEYVLLYGPMPNKDLIYAYSSSDFTILPSFLEPFGLVIVESLACGKPVIASNIGGPAHILKEQKAGCLVDPGDSDALAEKILLLLKDKDLRKRMGDEALKLAKEYDWENIARKLLNVYKNNNTGLKG